MTLRIYGISGSRAIRSLWAIEETGQTYEHIKTNFAEDSKSADYLAVNPNGRIPALVDGELILFESMAINLYLARKYAPDLYPASEADQAKTMQWSVWGISEIEPLQMQIVIQSFFTPKDKQNPKVIASAANSLKRPLAVLDNTLADSAFLLGDKFGIADLNVAAVMLLLDMVKHDYSEFTHVSRWAQACYNRPALKRAQAL